MSNQHIKQSPFFYLVLAILLCSGCSSNSKNESAGGTGVVDSTASEKNVRSKVYEPVSPALYNEILSMDSGMFAAFNAHDIAKLKTVFSTELEFYHDKGGLTNYDETMKNFNSLFERNNDTGLRRELVPNSVEVYPIKDYGAIETGEHKFCHQENGVDDCGTFKFVHIWKKDNNQWKVTRVMSYDH